MMNTNFSVLLCFPNQTTKQLNIPAVPSDSDHVEFNDIKYDVLHPTWLVVGDDVIVKVPLKVFRSRQW